MNDLHPAYRRIAGVICALGIIVVAYFCYWYILSIQVGRYVESIIEHKSPKLSISFGEVASSGFPFIVRKHFSSPSLMAREGELQWHSEVAILEMRPWNLHQYRISSSGQHNVQLRGFGKTHEYMASAKGGVLKVKLKGMDQGWGATLQLAGFQLTNDGGQKIFLMDNLEMSILTTDKLADGSHTVEHEVTVKGNAIKFPQLVVRQVENKIQTLRIGLKLLGEIPEFKKSEVASWHQSGGVLEIKWLQAVWGAVDLRAAGIVGLDDELRFRTLINIDVQGYTQVLDTMATIGLISQNMARTGSTALKLIAKPQPDGSSSVLSISLKTIDGYLYLGPVRLIPAPSLFP